MKQTKRIIHRARSRRYKKKSWVQKHKIGRTVKMAYFKSPAEKEKIKEKLKKIDISDLPGITPKTRETYENMELGYKEALFDMGLIKKPIGQLNIFHKDYPIELKPRYGKLRESK